MTGSDVIPAATITAESEIVAKLRRSAEQARGAYARNTNRALRADLTAFQAWCTENGVEPLPASSETIVAFIDAMASTKAPASVRRYLSSIATAHRMADQINPTETLPVKLALKRMHREKGRAQTQAAGLTRALVDKLLASSGLSLRDLRNRAMLAVAYDTLARRSELVALQVEDVEVGAHGDGSVKIRRGKTDQEGAGAIRYLAPDTVLLLREWLSAAVIESGPLFRSVLKGNRIGGRLDAGDVAKVFKAMARAAGVPEDRVGRISGHSTRVGAAQDMASSERIELAAIMQSGGWKSPEMVSCYTARQAARRSGAAKLAVMQNRA